MSTKLEPEGFTKKHMEKEQEREGKEEGKEEEEKKPLFSRNI